MDRIELVHIVSTQGKNAYLVLPEVSEYKTSMSLDTAKYDQDREVFKDERRAVLGEDLYNLLFKANLPDSRYRFWGFGGAGDNRVWDVREWDDFFDPKALDEYLRARGSGGVVVREGFTLREEEAGKLHRRNRLSASTSKKFRTLRDHYALLGPTRQDQKNEDKNVADHVAEGTNHLNAEIADAANAPHSAASGSDDKTEQQDQVVREMDVLLMSEALSVFATRFVFDGDVSGRFVILPCEDSTLPVKVQFFRSQYYFHRGTRCIARRDQGSWLDFPKMRRVLQEEVDFVYREEMAHRRRWKQWNDALQSVGHWERDVVDQIRAENEPGNRHDDSKIKSRSSDEKKKSAFPPVNEILKFGRSVEHSRYVFRDASTRTYMRGQPVLRVGFNLLLGEALEGDKMHLGKYQNWGANTIAANSVWSGIVFTQQIQLLGDAVIAAIKARFARANKSARSSRTTTSSSYEVDSQKNSKLWVVHWRRGDGEVGPTDVRAQQFRQAPEDNLANLVKKTVVAEFFRESLVTPGVYFADGALSNKETKASSSSSASSAMSEDLQYEDSHYHGMSSGDMNHKNLNGSDTERNDGNSIAVVRILRPSAFSRKRDSIRYRDFAPHFFVMTNEINSTVLDVVREGFSEHFPVSTVQFLGDFLSEDDRDQAEPLSARLKMFLKRGGIFALLLELYIACRADVFLGYHTALFEGAASMPTMLANQLRLHQCARPPALGLFHPVKEYLKRYSG
ncbi:unnamed protein product [Amoebophrya sp. A25]|nr:unnamed protein product [Amoebophrya sp. A25]|eukprot:GSA25T00026965001.1